MVAVFFWGGGNLAGLEACAPTPTDVPYAGFLPPQSLEPYIRDVDAKGDKQQCDAGFEHELIEPANVEGLVAQAKAKGVVVPKPP